MTRLAHLLPLLLLTALIVPTSSREELPDSHSCQIRKRRTQGLPALTAGETEARGQSWHSGLFLGPAV